MELSALVTLLPSVPTSVFVALRTISDSKPLIATSALPILPPCAVTSVAKAERDALEAFASNSNSTSFIRWSTPESSNSPTSP